MSLVFISSMFRSGTTLIARMLNVHPEIVCASDPMRPLVNSFRYDLAGDDYRLHHDRFDPLGDYFINDTELLSRALLADLDMAIGCDSRDLLDAIKRRALPFSGLFADALDTATDVASYADAMRYLLDTIRATYAKGSESHATAFKEVWSTEFYPALRRSFPGAKCMVIVRDPRSVVASKVASGEPYPIVFMGRQWRKLTCLAAYMKQAYPDDVLLFRYEDFIREPEQHAMKMCHFTGIPFREEILDGSRYRDGRNQPWQQNTSYANAGANSINAGTMDRWRSLLTGDEVKSIELYTYDWMKTFGYRPESSLDDLLNVAPDHYRRYETNALADWIRPFSFDDDLPRLEREIMLEKLRLTTGGAMLSGENRMGLHVSWW
jgi:hypothetical protein